MATTNRIYILAAFFFSGIAAVFNIVSLSTEQWITGKLVGDGSQFSYVNYGLFQGNYKRNLGVQAIYEVKMTCDLTINACALLCDSDERQTLLHKLYYNTVDPNYDPMAKCTSTTISQSFIKLSPVFRSTAVSVSKKNFINEGIWLSTVVCVILAILLGAFSSVLSLYNTVSNPIRFFLSVGSLFFYNGFALAFTLLYMIFWGTMYNLTIFHNVGLYDTLTETLNSDKTVFLGYSYWISFAPMALYGASIGILIYREYLNARDPKQQTIHLEDSTDPNIYLY